MAKVEWTDDLSVGVGLIDEQHKMLIERLNNLTDAVEAHQGPTETAGTLDFLIEYTHFHFSREEKHMEANDYPGLRDHVARHAEFKTTLADIERDYREEGPTHELAEAIDALLVNWLVKHIRAVDAAFGAFLRDNGIVLAEED